MRCILRGQSTDIRLYDPDLHRIYDLPGIESMNRGRRYCAFASIGGQDYFLKFVPNQKDIKPELDRAKKIDNYYFAKFVGTEEVEGWTVAFFDRVPGKALAFYDGDVKLTVDDGLIILDQIQEILREFQKQLILNNRRIDVDFCTHNCVYDKPSRMLKWVDYGICSCAWPQSFFWTFLTTMEKIGAVDASIVEDCVHQYFALLYETKPIDLGVIQRIEQECRTGPYGAPPYESVRITSDYYLNGSRWTEHRNRVLQLGNLSKKTVLDLGCNIGGATIEAGRRNAEKIVSYDINPHIIDLARRLAAELGIKADFHVADVGELKAYRVHEEAQVDKFDVVFFFSLWIHITNKRHFVEFLKDLDFEVLYWEGHSYWPVEDSFKILQSTEVFEAIEFLGYADNYKYRLNSRPMFMCTKKKG